MRYHPLKLRYTVIGFGSYHRVSISKDSYERLPYNPNMICVHFSAKPSRVYPSALRAKVASIPTSRRPL